MYILSIELKSMNSADRRGTRRNGTWRSISTGAQEGLWGPGFLPLPGFSITPHPASPGAPETSQMGLYTLGTICMLNYRIKQRPTSCNSEREYPNSGQHLIWQC